MQRLDPERGLELLLGYGMGMARRGVFAFAFLSDGQCCCHGGNSQLHVDDDDGSDRTSLKDGNELSIYMMKNHGHGIAFFFQRAVSL